ncbi:TPA: DnaJ domain-containing protein [Legionella pneumophila]|uniref:DnaJ domain-containing protein n=1 Tax=Legionella pneumophila TaxID=446 RepID=UPI0007876080|nr:DnaJ domain-containing protein [Legionella pneumophila]HAU1191925.1 DnaJ domain-containing protein [Legionella pneumophila]HBD7101979.1 DnaJ domain-containing protein [Legionella pneumophila]HCO4738485.1 DnaJ domain-containing protein [Legionella pneumophila]HDU7928981.1 DnaJ domain-containing protein [Legionella pneumophila]HDU7935346.1 DnaJ domain-containing protein [Legionella pneumophila]
MPHIPQEIIAYFQLLGLPTNATENDLNRAFRALAMKYHPDKNKNAGAEEKFKEYENARDQVKAFLAGNNEKPSSTFDPETPEKHSAYRCNNEDTSQAFDTHYSTTSRAYIKNVYSRTGILDLYASQIDIPENISLDEECVFYVVFPFLKPDLECNPYDIENNIFNAKGRYARLFTDLEQAQHYACRADSRMTTTGSLEAALYKLKHTQFVAQGIVYSLRGCPRIIIECFARGGFEVLIPLMTEYYIPKTYKVSADLIEAHKEYKIAEANYIATCACEKTHWSNPVQNSLKVLDEKIKIFCDQAEKFLAKTLEPSRPSIFAKGIIPTAVIETVLNNKPNSIDYLWETNLLPLPENVNSSSSHVLTQSESDQKNLAANQKKQEQSVKDIATHKALPRSDATKKGWSIGGVLNSLFKQTNSTSKTSHQSEESSGFGKKQ